MMMYRPTVAALILLACALPTTTSVAQISTTSDGKTLFVHRWSSEDPLSAAGDGLGPLFNGRSCVQCHHLGGVGGAGGIEHNIDFLASNSTDVISQERLTRFHPGFFNRDRGKVSANIILHRFSLNPLYTQQREQSVGSTVVESATGSDTIRLHRSLQLEPLQQLTSAKRINVIRSQRNSPALFGAGLINQVTDHQLIMVARSSKRQFGANAGRLSVIKSKQSDKRPAFGRFGWRGQTESLQSFVVDACAIELGLELSMKQQTADPNDPKYRPAGVDINDEQVRQLSNFVARLPTPVQIFPQEVDLRQRVAHGKNVFGRVGCANCHVENIGSVAGIFSDLLLHDMGNGLADPVAASLAVDLDQVANAISGRRGRGFLSPTPQGGGSYGGGDLAGGFDNSGLVSGGKDRRGRGGRSGFMLGGKSLEDIQDRRRQQERLAVTARQEWRTPPLWGVADSAPYIMHDGRAETLVEAIAGHGGQARESVASFFETPVDDQLALVQFLHTLRAPR